MVTHLLNHKQIDGFRSQNYGSHLTEMMPHFLSGGEQYFCIDKHTYQHKSIYTYTLIFVYLYVIVMVGLKAL